MRLSNMKELAIGCAVVASNPRLFELSEIYKCMYHGILVSPPELPDVTALRFVKGPKEASSAVSRGVSHAQFNKDAWHYIRFVDRDNQGVSRCVMWWDKLANVTEDFSSIRNSAAIQYKYTDKAFNQFLRFPGIQVMGRFEIGHWKVAAYVDKHPKTYRLVIAENPGLCRNVAASAPTQPGFQRLPISKGFQIGRAHV